MRKRSPHHPLRFAAVSSVLATLVLAACSPAADPSNTDSAEPAEAVDIRLSLDWSSLVAYHAPFVLAQEQGIFADYGLNVEWTLPEGSADAVLAVATDKADIAWADLTTAAASMLQGVPVTAVARVLQQNPLGLTVLSDITLEDADDVGGLRIGSTPGGSDSTVLPAVLATNGISMDEVQIINLPANGKFPALLTGDVDAISGQVYFYVTNAEAEGFDASGVLYSDLGLDMLASGFVANDAFIASNGEAITRFLEAYREALAITIGDPAAACEAVVTASEGAVIQESCERQLELWLPLATAVDDTEWGLNNEEQWVTTVETLITYGGATGDREPVTMFTNDLVPTS